MKSNILAILSEINNVKGVTGSLLMTTDGIIVASLLNKGGKDSAFAAFSSAVSLTIKKSLSNLNINGYNRYTIIFESLKLFVINLDNSILLVLTDNSINKEDLNITLFQSIGIIKKLERM